MYNYDTISIQFQDEETRSSQESEVVSAIKDVCPAAKWYSLAIQLGVCYEKRKVMAYMHVYDMICNAHYNYDMIHELIAL